MFRNTSACLVAWCAMIVMGTSAAAQTVWAGPPIVFSKAAYADPSDAANQDRITSNVWITRGDIQGIYNAASESSFTHYSSPVDTEWAYGTTASLGSLTFADWETWACPPPSTFNQDAVLHLITDDIYIDIKFLSWGDGHDDPGGPFSYQRSTPIPEPTSVALLGLAASLSLLKRRRR